MARRWRNPRDGTSWLVEVTPFEGPVSDHPGEMTPVGWQVFFHSDRDHCTILVAYEVGARLDVMGDGELLALLDASRAEV